MAGIRSKDTKPEKLIRSKLHQRGFRFRVSPRGVYGSPDIVLPRYSAVIFVHGCFWHSHECHLFRLPGTRPEFWRAKLARNRERDVAVHDVLESEGWRQLVVWECALKGSGRLDPDDVADRIGRWIVGRRRYLEILGNLAK